MIHIAFPLIGGGSWTGGLVYLKNTLQVIQARLKSEVKASVFMSPSESIRFGGELASLVEGRVIVDSAFAGAGRGQSLLRALVTGFDSRLLRFLKNEGVDVTFEVASFFGSRFELPVIAWMPDFQHRHMPAMFTRANWLRRELGFRAQIRSGRTVMVTSQAALEDLERFYSDAHGRGHVVSCALNLDLGHYFGRAEEMRATYKLPERFFYMPNQFWRHKNHAVIIDALAHLRAERALDGVPPVILSGLTKDPRHPDHFKQIMARAKRVGVEDHFHYLGLIPYDHVLTLTATCDAVVNPSFFEGLSLPVQEAKALGAPLILSDISIHREQAPCALFFDPTSPQAAAAALIEIAQRPPVARPQLSELIAAQNQRLDEHASSLLDTVRAAAERA